MRRGADVRRRLAAAAVVAAAVVVACGARAAPASVGGGTMNGKVTVLGEVGPRKEEGNVTTSVVDVVPVVLWSGATPKVVLRYELHTNRLTRHLEQRFVRADGRKEGPFPHTASATVPLDLGSEDELDLYDPEHVVVADVDGDGTDELVLLRGGGSVDVVGASRVVSRTAGVVPRAKIGGYFPKGVQRARAGGKDVVFVLYARKPLGRATDEELVRAGLAERYQLVRIDDRGATRLAFEAEGFRPEEVAAVGAVNRPGSSQIDEVVAVSRQPGARAWVLSRHAPNGKLLAPPREIYVPFGGSGSVRFAFVAQSARAVAFDQGDSRAYFFAPEKPANWVRAVEVPGEGSQRGGWLLGVVEPGAPRVLVRKGNDVYAVDEAGGYHGVVNGAWARLPRAEPCYRIAAPSPAHKLIGVYAAADGGDGFLVVQAREAAARELSEDELVAAGDRFLPPGRMRLERAEVEPTLTGWDPGRDELIAEERARKGGEPPTSVDDWRARFPESFAAWSRKAHEAFRIGLKVALVSPREPRRDAFRDYDGWLSWRDGLVAPAETVFTAIRGATAAASVRVEGRPVFMAKPALGLPDVSFRVQGGAVTAVLAMEMGTSPRQVRRFATVTGP